MSRQTLFRQQRKIEVLHKIAASVEGGRKNKFEYLRAHNPVIGKPVRGFPPGRGASRLLAGDDPMLRSRRRADH
jgi:hypothetical protein